ncbi:MAG: hypothetical protein K2G85_10135 [Muribaculaceae bacterium]|nr:hypothetical protein [Muribaculaceae bacterium]
MKRLLPAIIMALILMIPACGSKNKNSGDFPENFNSLSDEQKVAYMMEHVSADSVARFIIFAALGKIDNVRIDSLNNAALKAYETYKDTALQSFSWEFDRIGEELPIHDKMRLRTLIGSEDPQGLGLTLGLEYLNRIRVNNMSAEQVFEELTEFKKASADDPDLYARFLIGFRTVLRYDKNSDMPKEIYDRFLNFDEDVIKDYYARNKAVSNRAVTLPDSILVEDGTEDISGSAVSVSNDSIKM